MISKVSQLRLKGFRLARFVISCAVWAYQHGALSLRDVVDLLGRAMCDRLLRKHPRWVSTVRSTGRREYQSRSPGAEWQMVPWRDHDLNPRPQSLVFAGGRPERQRAGDPGQSRRNAHTPKWFLWKLVRRWGVPRIIVTHRLCSYGVTVRTLSARAAPPQACSVQSAIVSLQDPTAALGSMPPACGTIILLAWLHGCGFGVCNVAIAQSGSVAQSPHRVRNQALACTAYWNAKAGTWSATVYGDGKRLNRLAVGAGLLGYQQRIPLPSNL